MARIYLASSWRNRLYEEIHQLLCDAKHEVYDFKNPIPEDYGFSWSDVDPDWMSWNPEEMIRGLEHPACIRGYDFDKKALDWCNMCVMLMPCGKSAHLEAGYCIGAKKPTCVYFPPLHTIDYKGTFEPELMYLLATSLITNEGDLVSWTKGYDPDRERFFGGVRCMWCGRFRKVQDLFGYCPYGSAGDLEPPDQEVICKDCLEKNPRVRQTSWRGPYPLTEPMAEIEARYLQARRSS